jgi:pimeloyl-ACP methyl ester carboxylesterase
LDGLVPARPYILIGHSDGGSIALIHGATRPDGLKAVVTMAAHVFVEQITLEGIKAAKKAFAAGKLDGLYTYHGDKTDTLFSAWADTWLSPEFNHWNIESLLPDVQADALVIQGADDQYGTRSQVDRICSQVSGKRQPEMIPDCGHAPHTDQPEATITLISEFLRMIG